MSQKMRVTKVELKSDQIKAFLADPGLRVVLKDAASEIYASIPASDGDPKAKRVKGQKQKVGRYTRKFKDDEAIALDGRVAIHVGVEDADRGFFRLMTLQKAIKATGAKMKRRKGK